MHTVTRESGWGPKFCISNKLLGAAAAADLWTYCALEWEGSRRERVKGAREALTQGTEKGWNAKYPWRDRLWVDNRVTEQERRAGWVSMFGGLWED